MRWRHGTALLIALALVPGAAQAQMPQPRLQSVQPTGGQAGQTVDVIVRGADLEDVNALWFDHPGLRAFHLKGLTFRVAIAPGTPMGQHDIRVLGPTGVSNPRVFVVGDRPEYSEVEPNDQPSQANPVARNTVVIGEIGPTDIDCFSFEGKQGERLFIEVWAARIDSRLDAMVRVLAPNGTEIAESEGRLSVDPFVDLTLPADGRYTIKLHDVIYAGSPDAVYRFSVHNGPHLDAVTPSVAAPGVATTFTLFGRNLGGEPCAELQIDGRPIERKEITLRPPAAPEPGAPRFGIDFLPAVSANTRGFPIQAWGPSGLSNPVTIAEASEPLLLEQEPNDDDQHAQMVTLPCDVAGSFGAVGDVDIFRFHATKGDVWWFEASSERLGSPADPCFTIQRVVAKGPPQDLASGDDMLDPPLGNPFPTGTVDAALRWQAPDDGVFQVAINDLYNSQRGDCRFTYRLTIRPERPDFALFLVPSHPNVLEGVTVRAGSRELAHLVVRRFDGFKRPIRVEAVDLPPGVSCETVVIGPSQAVTPIVFEAAENAGHVVGPVRLIGRGLSSERKEILDYVKGTGGSPPEVVHEAIAGDLTWPPIQNGLPISAPARVTRGLILAVRDGAPFAITASSSKRDFAPNTAIDVTVTLTRKTGFTETVQLAAIDLPRGVGTASATISKDQTSAVLKLNFPANVPPGVHTFVIQGSASIPVVQDPKAKKKPNINALIPSNPITVVIRK
jgi:hypothetical protein